MIMNAKDFPISVNGLKSLESKIGLMESRGLKRRSFPGMNAGASAGESSSTFGGLSITRLIIATIA